MSCLKRRVAFTGLALCWLCGPTLAESTDNTPAASSLEQVIAARSAADKSRDGARHPKQTLEFFQLEKGMTVAEALPEGGWYTRVLAPYLGSEGSLYGVNYSDEIWPLFGFMDKDAIAKNIASTKEFPKLVKTYTDNGINVESFTFSTVPDQLYNTVDRVLIIRALHNLNRFEPSAGSLSRALSAVRIMLKKGGMVGVVQHRLPESAADEGADGSRGYLKQSDVIKMFEQAGFELVASSEINANPKDRPGPEDVVWRLPPTLSGIGDDAAKKAAMEAIGESDRMTLLFKKVS